MLRLNFSVRVSSCRKSIVAKNTESIAFSRCKPAKAPPVCSHWSPASAHLQARSLGKSALRRRCTRQGNCNRTSCSLSTDGESQFESQAEASVRNFTQKSEVKNGAVIIRQLAGRDVSAATELLAASFEDVLAKKSKIWVKKLLLQALEEVPDAACLVAHLAQGEEGALEDPLVGMMTLSFTAGTREEEMTTRPPDDAPYLSNMAVDAAFRRRGIARVLMEAGEVLVSRLGKDDIWLHVLVSDEPTRVFYFNCGYEEIKRDNFAVGLFGGRGRASLMVKRLV